MKKRLLSFILCTVLCADSVICLAVAANAQTEVSARAAVLYEPEGGRWVFEKNADLPMPMASTTKVMTAMLALRMLDADSVHAVPREACGIEGSSLYLREGDTVSVQDLLYALLLRSANDAASALAILACGSEEAFAAEMNAEARRIGLKNTSFKNPHGLDAEGHYSSARDLALTLAAAMKDERFVEISGCEKHTVTLEGRSQVLYNHNKLLHLTSGVICGKTGFTKKSGRCLVSAAERNGVRLIAVTMNAPNDWQDHIALYADGFERFERRSVIGENDAFRVPLAGGERDYLLCRAAGTFSAVTEKGSEIKCDVLLPSLILAPVKRGDVIGMLRITEGEKVLAEICLAADEDAIIKETKRPSLLKRWWQTVFGR